MLMALQFSQSHSIDSEKWNLQETKISKYDTLMSTVVSRKISFFTTAVSSNSGDKHPGIKMLAKLRPDKLQCIGVHTRKN